MRIAILFSVLFLLATISTNSACVFAKSAPPPCVRAFPIPPKLLASRTVIFGETHGTIEAPRLVGDYACQLLAGGRSVVIGLEIQSSEQERIDAFLASSGNSDDVSRLVAGPHWHRRQQDGRSSEAMFELIENARLLRGQGGDIEIVAIDGYEPNKTRDSIMAENLRAVISRRSSSSIVVLVGSFHASKKRGSYFDPGYEPLAYLIADSAVSSLLISALGGQAWVCTSSKPQDMHCGVTGSPVDADVKSEETLQLGVADPTKYDGKFFVGATHASPPKVAATEPMVP